ncbi:MAG: patatin-like phospholipase family protein [Myxococcales bacterium]|nr:patatin-like phospholipase family protein [Myxococcales bacterium]
MSKPRIAFVGSGGASKGVAHLGAFKAMEELGIEPDILVGASAGAIVSSLYAAGFRSEHMIDWFRPMWQRREGRGLGVTQFFGLPTREQLSRPGYLTSGLLSIDRFEAHLRELLPVNDFESLRKTLLVTAADVDGRGRTVFGRGYVTDVPVSKAVAASSCVPVLFRPYRIGDRYYIDGEVVRTLSIDLAVEAGADVVIVSNVYRPQVTPARDVSVALRGVSAVARQTLNVVLWEKEKRGIDLIHRQYPHVTVLNVSADLGAFPFTAPLHAKKLIGRGYKEARRVLGSAQKQGVFDVRVSMRPLGEA